MPRLVLNRELTFTFEEADKLMAYMEKVGAYGGARTGKTAFQVMEEFDVLETFSKLREMVKMKYEEDIDKMEGD